MIFSVATVPTACGIETVIVPFVNIGTEELQQCLPLAVLKHDIEGAYASVGIVATVPTACGIETVNHQKNKPTTIATASCNSAYRLRY